MTPNHAAWVAETLQEYAKLLNLDPPPDIEAQDFETARTLLHERVRLPFPERLDFDECRLEWANLRAEGEIKPSGHIGRFTTNEGSLNPPIGALVKVRLPNGSLRALVVGRDGQELLLMRAPNRRERRLHPRIRVSGVAMVTWQSREEVGDLDDLSEGGVGMTLPLPIEIGNSIHLMLRIHGKQSLPIECDGIVTSCRTVQRAENGHHRVGVKFTDISPALLERIREELRAT